MQNELQVASNKELFKNPSMPNIAVREFGIAGFGILDVKEVLFPSKAEFVIKQVDEDNNSGVGSAYDRIIDDSLWKEAAEGEKNKNYKLLNNYYLNKKITAKNEYTGLLEDKNLIVIMIESGSNVLLDYPEYFPNINKLYNEGWAWDNFFSPRNTCSTGNNEMTGLTSLHTINRECTANVYKNNKYFEAMFNLFNNKGYYTSSYHSYTDHFYYRKTYHPNMGSQKYYGVDDLGIVLGDGYQPWPSDVELIEKSTPHYINENKFMSWITTVSSHMTYTSSSVTGDMHLDMFKDQKWNKAAKRYMSKLVIVDNAIGELIKELEDAGKLDDTVIAIYADHEPYGLSEEVFQSIAKYDIKDYGNVDRTPFIIYNSKMTPRKFSEYSTYINILPTLANLFDLDYDPRLYGGTDLLSEDYPNFVAFADGSWRDENAYYDATTGKITYINDITYDSSYIVKINTMITNEISMNNLAIKEDYFNYLEKILNVDKESLEDTTE